MPDTSKVKAAYIKKVEEILKSFEEDEEVDEEEAESTDDLYGSYDPVDFEDDWDEVVDPHYDEMSDKDLMEAFFDVKKDLMDRGVLIVPVDPEDWDKQSRYLGMLDEMRKRNLV